MAPLGSTSVLGKDLKGRVAGQEDTVFTNSQLDLATISCFGFDMDYTLCEYISPEFDALACGLAAEWLVAERGYSAAILALRYDPAFPVRGLWYDRLLGNLLKTDQGGRVLAGSHGRRPLARGQLAAQYPAGIQRRDEARVFMMNTRFNLAETFLIAALTDFFDEQEGAEHTETGWLLASGVELTFGQLFQDLRAAIDDIHLTSLALKKAVVAEPSRFIRRDPRLPGLLAGVREAGRKAFLLTNSDWWYTHQVMTFLLGPAWTDCFALVGVDACKPRFWSGGTDLRTVATLEPGCPKVAAGGPAPAGPRVLSGGSAAAYCRLLGARGEQVVYVGDHLWADVIKCRKACDWRTVLVVPELEEEAEGGGLEIGGCGVSGSIFRCGGRFSFFGSQVTAWAEVYTARVGHLAAYSLSHRFSRPPALLPHEEEERAWAGEEGRRHLC